MKPTEILSQEHRVIEQVLTCLDGIVREGRENSRLDGEAAAEAIDFIRNFADRCHHGKEENQLFQMLEARGFPADRGPTAVMRYEHDEGRGYVRAMDAARQGAAEGDADALSQFAQNAEAFVELLRAHIQKEDLHLFRMADQLLTEEDQKELLALFEKVETHEMAPGTHERYLEIAHKLSERYGAAGADMDCGGCSGGEWSCCGPAEAER